MLKPYDVDFARAQYDAFTHPETGQWVMAENAGGSYAPRQVTDKLHHFMTATKTQPYWSFSMADAGGKAMDRSHAQLAAAINAEPNEVMFGPSTSMNTYVLAKALREELRTGDEVIVTNQDHEANVGAWRRLADGNSGIVVREWAADPETGRLGMEGLRKHLNPRTKLVCVTQCSNLVGEIHDIAAIACEVHATGARIAVDAVSYAPHMLADVKALDVDFYYFSLYKVFGPHQGLMYVKHEHLERLPNQGHNFNGELLGKRLTPAGPQHGEIACSGGIIDYLEAVYAHQLAPNATPEATVHGRVAAVMEQFHAHECALANRVLTLLKDKRARVLGPLQADLHKRAATIAFVTSKTAPEAVMNHCAQVQVAMGGGGHFYAPRLVEAAGLDPEVGVCRVSLVHYNSDADVDRLLTALSDVV